MEDLVLKYLEFNRIFKTAQTLKPKTILLYLKLLQRKGTFDNYWLTNLKSLKANIIQTKMKFSCKTDSKN